MTNLAAGGWAASLLTCIAGLHVYWAMGGFWPGHDEESLARTVVGGRPGMRGPGTIATWAVVILLILATTLVLGVSGWLTMPVPVGWASAGTWFAAGVLILRGLLGFVDHRLRPSTVGSSFARLNLRFYSPLCLLLALLMCLAARG